MVTFVVELGATLTVVGVPFDVDAQLCACISGAHIGVRHFVDQVPHLHFITLTVTIKYYLSQVTKLQS